MSVVSSPHLPTDKMAVCVFCSVVCCVVFTAFVQASVSGSSLHTYHPEEIASILEQSCFIGVNVPANEQIIEVFINLRNVFADEHVTVGAVSLESFSWPDGEWLKIRGRDCKVADFGGHLQCTGGPPEVVFFAKKDVDRTCLLSPAHTKFQPSATVVKGASSLETLVEYVNAMCQTFRKADGGLLPAGHQRRQILDNVFTVRSLSNVTMGMVYDRGSFLNVSFLRGRRDNDSNVGVCERDRCTGHDPPENNIHHNCFEIAQCDTINYTGLTWEEFFHDYLKRSRPVVIKGAISDWLAFSGWTQDYLRAKYGNRTVHVKLTPGGDFEGVEPAELWEDYGAFTIPDAVLKKLPFPDLVVVRPAGVNMKFSDFLDLITSAAEQPTRNMSAYLEYSSIAEYMPELVNDVSEFPFVKDKLSLRHLNMWLSDGNTVGRLHFDPFDNFLCQLRGRKQLILFEPFNNSRLYEGHIPQATLSYKHSDHTFRRKTLEDSTSMVMSPVDLFEPDLERFPNFREAQPLNCTIDEGDVLFMPAFWWHEVYSFPSSEEKRNLAVNFWYEPFLTKEFPCPACKMDVNPFYFHLLY